MHGDHLSVFAAAAGSLYSLFIDATEVTPEQYGNPI
jgi:hypothetical protein